MSRRQWLCGQVLLRQMLQPIPVCNTNKISAEQDDRRTACHPDTANRRGFFGSNGLISSNSPAGTARGYALIDTLRNVDDRCHGLRYRRAGPFIQIEVLRRLLSRPS